MDDKIDILQENYDDSLFALLMSGLVREVGAYYIEENIRLQQDPEAAMPPAMERRILDAIDRAAARRRREQRGRRTLRIVNRVGAVAAAAALLFTTAFAASEDFRVGVTNLVYRVTDQVASWSFVQENDLPVPDFVEVPPEDVLPDVQCRWLPEGYYPTPELNEDDGFSSTQYFGNADGDQIEISIVAGSVSYHFNVEDADRLEELMINGSPAYLIEKNGTVDLEIANEEFHVFLDLFTRDADADTLIQMAKNLVLVPY